MGEGKFRPRVLISVPKSRHPKATDRNKIKRLIRESYRITKEDILDRLSGQGINLKKMGFLYVEDELFSFAYLKERMERIPSSLIKSIQKKNA